MDALLHQVAQRLVHRALPLNPVHIFKLQRDDFDGEVALAAAIIPGMAAMLGAVIDDAQMDWPKGFGQSLFNFGSDRAFRFLVHGSYIGMLNERSTLGLAPKT